MSNDNNALRPLANNGNNNGIWSRIREHANNVLSPSKEAEADKENVYPQLSQGKDIETEREKVRWRERGQHYEHTEEEAEDEDDDDTQDYEDTREGSIELDETPEENPFVRGAGRAEAARMSMPIKILATDLTLYVCRTS